MQRLFLPDMWTSLRLMDNKKLVTHFITRYAFIKSSPSEFYTQQFNPNFYFFSEDNFISPQKLISISKDSKYEGAYFIPYTRDISTTKILDSLS